MAAGLSLYWRFLRPFTLLVPAAGMISGALIALGAQPKWQSDWSDSWEGVALRVAAGSLMAAALNAFSNSINQIYDLEVDRINKPSRLLPSGRISREEAWAVGGAALVTALMLAWWINLQCLGIVATAGLLTFIYSAPPLRTKSRLVLANLTIAIPRGTLLMVAGWSTVKSVAATEPWTVGAVFGLFFLGAATTKDFSDMEGDRAGGCRTLPLVFGVKRAIWIISPFFVLPFLGMMAAAGLGLITAPTWIVMGLGLSLALWGTHVVRLLLRTRGLGSSKEGEIDWENHPSWRQMYWLALLAQAGVALAYLAR